MLKTVSVCVLPKMKRKGRQKALLWKQIHTHTHKHSDTNTLKFTNYGQVNEGREIDRTAIKCVYVWLAEATIQVVVDDMAVASVAWKEENSQSNT